MRARERKGEREREREREREKEYACLLMRWAVSSLFFFLFSFLSFLSPSITGGGGNGRRKTDSIM